MTKSTAIPFLLLLISFLSGCSHNSLYINGPDNYRVKLKSVLQADERYISILVASGIGHRTANEAVMDATRNVSEQQKAKGWDSYDLRLLQQTCSPSSDGYKCTQLHLVFEKP